MQLTKMFSNSMCLWLIESYDESDAMVISALFNTREHVESQKVF